MDYKTIQSLLEKYWEGNTSLEEEQALKTYFSSEDIAPDLVPYRSLFVFLEQKDQIKTSDQFETRLIKELTALEQKERTNRYWLPLLTKVAAAVLLVLSAYFYYDAYSKEQSITLALETESYETPEEAYEKTKELLLMVSSKLKKGREKASEGVIKLSETTQRVIKE